MAGVTRVIDFNAGTHNATITAGGNIAQVTGTPTYSNDGIHGGMGMAIGAAAPVNASTFIRADLGAQPASHAGQAYYRPKTQSASFTNLLRFGDASNNPVFTFAQTATKFTLLNEAGTTVATSALTWADQWYRWDWLADFTTPATPVLVWRIYATPESFTPTEQISVPLTATRTFSRWLIGAVGAGSASSTRSMRYDTIRIADGDLNWIPPFVPAYTGSLALAGGGSLAAAGSPGVTGSLGLSGSGSIGTGATPQPRESINLSGSGQLAAAGNPDVAAALQLGADGNLSAAGQPALPGYLQLSGSGLLVPAGTPALGGHADLEGEAVLHLQGAPGMQDNLHLTGGAQLAVAGSPAPAASLDLGGSAQLGLSGVAEIPKIIVGHLTAGDRPAADLAAGDPRADLTATDVPTSRLEATA